MYTWFTIFTYYVKYWKIISEENCKSSTVLFKKECEMLSYTTFVKIEGLLTSRAINYQINLLVIFSITQSNILQVLVLCSSPKPKEV